jgi:hypothetical protein
MIESLGRNKMSSSPSAGAPAKKTNPLVNILGASTRRIVYGVYALAGLVLGSIQAGVGAVDTGTPDWIKVALAVYAYIGIAIGATAASNAKDSTT